MKNESQLGISMHGSYRRVVKPFKMNFQAQGRVEAQVLDPDGTIRQKVETPNLILNQGLDGIAVRKWCDSFLYCAVGSGATAISVDSGVTTASQAGTVVTLSGGSFVFTNTVTDAGRVIRWDSLETARIVTITSPTVANVDVSQTVAAAEFTVYNAQQVGLTTEIQRTNNYLTGAGNCGTALATNVFSHKRTFDFPTEVGSVTYREIGFSHTVTAGNNLFSRVKLPADLVLVTGQVLRVVYTLQLTVTPYVATPKTANIVGWPVSPATTTEGDEQIQLWGLSSVVTASGATIAYDTGGYVNEPSELTTAYLFLSTSGALLSAIGTSADRTGTSPSEQIALSTTYTALAFTLDKYTIWDTAAANSTAWQTIGLGLVSGGSHAYTYNTFAFVFDQDQTKDDQHTLQINFTFTWGRDLS